MHRDDALARFWSGMNEGRRKCFAAAPELDLAVKESSTETAPNDYEVQDHAT